MKLESIITEDGSSTIHVPFLKETYHSRYGALTESVHVYIEKALYERISFQDLKEVNVLEVGFGTGLNALLTIIGCQKKEIKLNYIGIEPKPLDNQVIGSLNYTEILSHPQAKTWFDWLHESEWNEPITKEGITIEKKKMGIESFKSEVMFDVVYFDAFAPEKHPEIWTIEIYKSLFSMMNEGGILTTYCAKGKVKRELLGSGFMVENLSGPPGKREMTRATKPPQNS